MHLPIFISLIYIIRQVQIKFVLFLNYLFQFYVGGKFIKMISRIKNTPLHSRIIIILWHKVGLECLPLSWSFDLIFWLKESHLLQALLRVPRAQFSWTKKEGMSISRSKFATSIVQWDKYADLNTNPRLSLVFFAFIFLKGM